MTAGLQPVPANDHRVGIQTLMDNASNYNRWIADQARAHVGFRVLDAGCGAGNLSAMLLDRDLVVGVDVWDDFVELVGRRFAHHTNFQIHRFDLSDSAMVEALREHQLDSAMLSNVLEHIEDDGAVLRNIASVLPPGSPIFLLVPAFMGIYGAHDREDHHFRRYTKRSLAKLLTSLPVTMERQYYMNLPGFFAWYVLGRVMGKPLGQTEVSLYDKLVPLIRAIEDRVRPPFGQSLVALLRTTAYVGRETR
jgi:SAM-dependent methyltransferase